LNNKGGCLKLIDRIKNIFKLQHGEFVAPEKIENVLTNSKWVMQLMVYGDSFQAYVVAIIIPKSTRLLNGQKLRKYQEHTKSSATTLNLMLLFSKT
jgi:long-chain acyl-CoA synthetase